MPILFSTNEGILIGKRGRGRDHRRLIFWFLFFLSYLHVSSMDPLPCPVVG